MTSAVKSATRLVPLMEAFGPTIQGEGYLAGLPTLFLRFGLCDYRCDWCDSKFSVEPQSVKDNGRKLGQNEILDLCLELNRSPGMWVTLSGGNPAMHDLRELVAALHLNGYLVSVETQGSLWRDWLFDVDHLTISPKPPSSGQLTDVRVKQTERFFENARRMYPDRRSCKIVVFDDADFSWARDFIVALDPSWQTFISVGTPSVSVWDSEVHEAVSDSAVRNQIGDRYRWLCETVASDPAFVGTRVLPQLHVISWGHRQGV